MTGTDLARRPAGRRPLAPGGRPWPPAWSRSRPEGREGDLTQSDRPFSSGRGQPSWTRGPRWVVDT